MTFLYKTLVSACLCALFFAATTASFNTLAEPYLAVKNKLKCVACHVNPNGGGLRNKAFGQTYGQFLLPSSSIAYNARKLTEITQYISLGGDARFNAKYQKDDESVSQGFEVSSAQLYLNVAVATTGLSFYLDQQVAPGSALNREAFAMYQFDDGDFVKAGKMFLPYGLRIEDDAAFIRQATGMNFDNSDNGIEYGLNYANTTVNLYVANGTSQSSNDDDSLLYGARLEHLFDDFRIGVSGAINDNAQQTTMFNVYAGTQWSDFTFLTEIDYISFKPDNNVSSQDVKQLVSLFEVNYQWKACWNFKVTAEYFDPDQDVDEDHQTRYSFVTEYTPISHIQLRAWLRIKADIPQKVSQNNDEFFIQSHFYF